MAPDAVKSIAFVGDAGVGKSSFIQCYTSRNAVLFEGDYSVFRQYRVDLPAVGGRGRTLNLRFLDLPAGTTRLSRKNKYPDSLKLVVICFAIDSVKSFENATTFWPGEVNSEFPTAKQYLLGLKSDARRSIRRTVFESEASEAHREGGFSGWYWEASVQNHPQAAIECMRIIIEEATAFEPFVFPP